MANSELDIINAALYRVGDKAITSGDYASPTTVAGKMASQFFAATRDEELRLHPWAFALVRVTISSTAATPGGTMVAGTGADTLGATNIVFTPSLAFFTSVYYGMTIRAVGAPGIALITAVPTDGSYALATILEAFATGVGTMLAGEWELEAASPANTFSHAIDKPQDMLRLWWVRHNEPYRLEGQRILANVETLEIVYVARIEDTTLFDPLFDEALTCRLAQKFAYGLTGKEGVLKQQVELYAATIQMAMEVNAIEQGTGPYEAEADPSDAESAIIREAVLRISAAPWVRRPEPTDLARLAGMLYAPARDELLRSHPWSWALKRATLTADTSTGAAVPENEWSYFLAKPADMLRLWYVRHNEPYRLEGDNLLANVTSLDVVYITRITDADTFDPNFRQALVALLTLRLGIHLASSQSGGDAQAGAAIVQAHQAVYDGAIDRAMGSNAIEQGTGSYEAEADPDDPEAAIIREAVLRLSVAPWIRRPEPTDLARLVGTFYPAARDELLRSYPWAWALKRATLTALAGTGAPTPVNQWDHIFDRPEDMLRLWWVRFNVPYRLEGDYILSDADSLDVVYITRVTEAATFDPMFRQALVAFLARRLALHLASSVQGGDAQTAANALKEHDALFTEAIQNASAVNAIEQGTGKYEAEDDATDLEGAMIREAVLRVSAAPWIRRPEPTDLARLAGTLYPATRDELLRRHGWTWALKRATLTVVTGTGAPAAPANEWANAIAKPDDMLRLWRVRFGVPYRMEGDYLVTDADSLDVVYITRVTDASVYDPMFRQALVALLTHRIAVHLASSQSGGDVQAAANIVAGFDVTFKLALRDARQYSTDEQGEGKYEEEEGGDVADIIQEALHRLGDPPLPENSDAIDTSHILSHFYGKARDELLRLHPWRFSRVRVHLDGTTTTTLSMTAESGTGVTITADDDTFVASDVQSRILPTRGGVFRILTVTDETTVIGDWESPTTDATDIGAGDWHFAAPWRWSWRYTKPTDLLRIVGSQWYWTYPGQGPITWLWLDGERWRGPMGEPWLEEPCRVEGPYIVSQAGPTLDLEYVQRVTDPTLFTADFRSCLAAMLAARAAWPLLKDHRLAERMDMKFASELKMVRTTDKLDGVTPPHKPTSLVSVRF